MGRIFVPCNKALIKIIKNPNYVTEKLIYSNRTVNNSNRADCSIRVGQSLCELHFNQQGFTICASVSNYLVLECIFVSKAWELRIKALSIV